MDSNYKRETIIYIIFLIFILFILFALPIFFINNYMEEDNFIKKSGIINLLKQFFKLAIIVLITSIAIILLLV